MQLLSPDPARRAVERYWLRYTPAWGAVAAVVMLSGAAERWGDLELMLLGVGMALGAVVPPLFFERERPFFGRAGVAMSASIVIVAFAMNYLCTPYFFDVLHMHYGFRAEIAIENNPVFLYFMTVAYFATYCALLGVALRASRALLPARLGRLRAGLGAGLGCFAVAFLETVLNSNPFMQRLFCFDDMQFMLWFGTLSYGLCFVCMLPAWMGGDDPATRRVAFGERMLRTAGGMAAIVVVFAALRHGVAPHVTTVVPGSRGLRDGGCLSMGGGVQPSANGANEGR